MYVEFVSLNNRYEVSDCRLYKVTHKSDDLKWMKSYGSKSKTSGNRSS